MSDEEMDIANHQVNKMSLTQGTGQFDVVNTKNQTSMDALLNNTDQVETNQDVQRQGVVSA
jgi:hypothetical protein